MMRFETKEQYYVARFMYGKGVKRAWGYDLWRLVSFNPSFVCREPSSAFGPDSPERALYRDSTSYGISFAGFKKRLIKYMRDKYGF